MKHSEEWEAVDAILREEIDQHLANVITEREITVRWQVTDELLKDAIIRGELQATGNCGVWLFHRPQVEAFIKQRGIPTQ